MPVTLAQRFEVGVTPRMRRVSRNDVQPVHLLGGQVTPRMRRVSRNRTGNQRTV